MFSLLLIGFIHRTLSKKNEETLNGPQSPTEWPAWINNITIQRTTELESINYNGSIFKVPELDWTQSTFIQPQMHGYDAYFYDINTHKYTYDKWNQDLIDRYGGIDSFLFWVTYTNIGADDRNQFDMNLAIPGSMTALQNMIQYFHSLTPPIKILFAYNPWDTGTRDSGNPDYETMAKFLNESGGDGFNGDTMSSVPEDFYTVSVDKYNHPIAIEPEGGGSLESMNWDTLGWGYWAKPYQPPVGRWKWYDARHMTNICDRWAQNHTDDLQQSFFNGIGFESWENVWGCWNGIVPRDGEALRRMATILRYFGNRQNDPSAQNFTQSPDWQPFIPIISDEINWDKVYASSFPVNKGKSNQQILYLMVNRDIDDIIDLSISFDDTFTNSANLKVYDCYHGQELKFTNTNNKISLSLSIEGLGYGAVLATMDTRTSNSALDTFLTTMNGLTKTPLNSYSTKWKYLIQTMTPITPTEAYTSPPDPNMVPIPWGVFVFNNTGVEIEGSDSEGVDVQYPWLIHPQKEHVQYLTMDAFYIDKFPVTCSEYKTYLDASGYKPTDNYNYLKNWDYNKETDTYSVPTGYDNKPVTYLGLAEARAYCEYNKKRLPHDYEWQYAAQGNTGYLYPWGNTQDMGIRFPKQQNGRSIPGPADVTQFVPRGNSMFNVSDLIGNVWQFTDEFIDNHTRAVITRGSANYRPNGSQWYFPNAFQLNQHNKYFLMDNSYERCGTIGFRCAADSVQPTTGKPMFWSGTGTYCNDHNMDANGELCGKISAGKGFTNLTYIGTLDWIQFGINSKDNSGFYSIRKDTSSMYIANITSKTAVTTFDNNQKGFYWDDGQSPMKSLSKDDASTYGVYTTSNGFEFVISNMKGGNIYLLRVFVGVWENSGRFDATLNIGGKTNATFSDAIQSFATKSLKTTIPYSNVCYEMVINVSSVSSNEQIQLLINWMINSSDTNKGYITLQAVTLQLTQTSQPNRKQK